MINFLYFLLGQFSQQRNPKNIEIENYLPFRYIEEVENLENDISFLIAKDLLGAIAYHKNRGYSFNFRSFYGLSDLDEAAKSSLRILKYFFLVFPDKFIDIYFPLNVSIKYHNQKTLKFLLENLKDKENFLNNYPDLFYQVMLSANLKAIKYFIEKGFKKERAFEYIDFIVIRDQIDFLEYFISIGYKIEEDFCQKYECINGGEIYKYIQETKNF